jgi:Uma2 family endonuclease
LERHGVRWGSPRDAMRAPTFAPMLVEGERITSPHGERIAMSPRRWPHAAAVEFFTEQLIRQLAGRYAVRTCLPFSAEDGSELAPDLAVTRKAPERRTLPAELLLLIEVAGASRRTDRVLTRAIYAAAGVPEYWIVDLTAPTVGVHTQPLHGGYAILRVLQVGDVLRPTLLPEVSIPVADIPR